MRGLLAKLEAGFGSNIGLYRPTRNGGQCGRGDYTEGTHLSIREYDLARVHHFLELLDRVLIHGQQDQIGFTRSNPKADAAASGSSQVEMAPLVA
jgi:hypothetical protein